MSLIGCVTVGELLNVSGSDFLASGTARRLALISQCSRSHGEFLKDPGAELRSVGATDLSLLLTLSFLRFTLPWPLENNKLWFQVVPLGMGPQVGSQGRTISPALRADKNRRGGGGDLLTLHTRPCSLGKQASQGALS